MISHSRVEHDLLTVVHVCAYPLGLQEVRTYQLDGHTGLWLSQLHAMLGEFLAYAGSSSDV